MCLSGWFFCLIFVLGFSAISYLTGLYIVKDDENRLQLVVRPGQVVFETDEKFLSVALDVSFMRCLFHNLTEKEWSKLEELSRLLSPAYLRFGGTDADRAVFSFDENFSHFVEDSHCEETTKGNVTITGSDWLKLNEFARKSKMKLIVDLNVLLRNNSKWDSSNARALLSFSEEFSLPLDFQLGNEPNNFRHVFGKTVSATQLAEDFHQLRALLRSTRQYQKSKVIGPEVTRPKLFDVPSLSYLEEFLSRDSTVDVVSWHQYYLNGRTSTLKDFTNPKTLDVLSEQISAVTKVVREHSKDVPIWISETSSAYGGGAPTLSDRFVASFLWLDKLGVAAKDGMSVVIRQSLFKNSYALIGGSLDPTPDFWISLFYKNVVGSKVLKVIPIAKDNSDKNHLRFYCHCVTSHSKLKGNIVIYGMNLSNKTESVLTSGLTIEYPIKAYVFSPESDNLESKSVLLNSRVLYYNHTTFDDLAEMGEDTKLPLTIGPYSIGFWLFQDKEKNSCDG